MKKAIFGGAALLLAGLGLTFTSVAADAHTPSISADCSGVQLNATSFDAGQANTWTVTVGGATQSGTFEQTFSQTFPVPQAGATTAWSARIVSYDGVYDSGVQSGSVGPCGTPTPPPPPPPTDVCADLPGDQQPGTECTPPPDTIRTETGSDHGCDVAFQGKKYGAGDLTYDTVFDDTHVFNADTSVWDLVTDTTGDIENVEFTPWTKDQQVTAGCVEKPGTQTLGHHGHHNHGQNHHDDTEVKGVQAHSTSNTTTAQPQPSTQVPTVVDAGLAGAIASDAPVASSSSSFVSVASVLAGAGFILILGAVFAPRRRTAA